MRGIADRNILDEFCADFIAVVEAHTEYILVSGYVAISSGRTRATEDIDMIIPALSINAFTRLHAGLTEAGFEALQSTDASELFSYLSTNLSIRYTRVHELLPEMELKFAKDELDEYQLKTKTQLPLTDLPFFFSNINVNVAFKEFLLKSPKDLEDAEFLRIVYSELIDESEIAHVRDLIARYRLQ